MSKPVIVSLIAQSVMRPKMAEGLSQLGTLHFIAPDELDAHPDICAQAEILVGVHSMQVKKPMLDKFPNLKMCADYGVGFDGFEIPEFVRRGIKLSHTPDVLSKDVADFGFALLLTLTRRTAQADKFVRDGRWPNSTFPLGTRIFGKKAGIAGLGRIGSVIAQRCAAFDMEVGYTARHVKNVPYRHFESLKDMAAWCDVLFVVIPGSPETYHLVDKEVLEALGPRGILVNIARGALVDTQALIQCLEEKKLGGAALDVFEHEPHVEDKLLTFDNVVVAPHIASGTAETRDDMADMLLRNVKCFLEGKPLENAVPGTQA